MSKRIVEVCKCDRCNIEHKGFETGGAYSVKVYSRSLIPMVVWDDLCPACSEQVDQAFKRLMIG